MYLLFVHELRFSYVIMDDYRQNTYPMVETNPDIAHGQ